MAGDKDISEITTELTNFLQAATRMYAGKTSATATDYWLNLVNFYNEGRNFIGQAHGGNYTKSFSATATFDADDGNNQYMAVTASTTIDISNLDEGTMIIKLKVTVGTTPTITIGSSLGDVMDGSADLINANGDVNTLTIVKGADGNVEYIVTAKTA